MSDDDSGVDSDNETNEPVLLAHRPVVPQNSNPEIQPDNASHHVIIDIDPPETNYSPSNNTTSSSAQLSNSVDNNLVFLN